MRISAWNASAVPESDGPSAESDPARGRELHAVPDGDGRPANIEGRRTLAAEDGFGQLWLKRYTVVLCDPAPGAAAVITHWREHFNELPAHSTFAARKRMRRGDVAAAQIQVAPGITIATGLLVQNVDDAGFSLITAEGHMFAGVIAFTVRDEPAGTVACVETRMRASDPLYEAGLLLGGHDTEDRFWEETLHRLATAFGSPEVLAARQRKLLDSHRHWRRARNVWYNAAIRTALQRLAAPLRLARHTVPRGTPGGAA